MVPLTILRWPLLGALLAILADTLDIVIFSIWGFPTWGYQELDKILDLYYLFLEVLVVQRWLLFERSVASCLFAYRLIGVALFEITSTRFLLFVFPNMFEMYFLFVLIAARFAPAYVLTPLRTLAWLAFLLIPKMLQEYLLHWARVLDDLVFFDVVADVWRSTRDSLGVR